MTEVLLKKIKGIVRNYFFIQEINDVNLFSFKLECNDFEKS
jgi:hypothetical protein